MSANLMADGADGADGAGGTSRRALGIGMQGPDCIQDFVNADVEHDLRPYLATRARLYFTLDPDSPGTFVARRGGGPTTTQCAGLLSFGWRVPA